MSRLRPKTLMLITAVLIFVGFTGGVTFLLYQRYFQGGGKSTETRSRASTAIGDVELKLVTASDARFVKDTFTVKVMLDTKGKKISGAAFGLSYPSGTGTTADLEVVDEDGNAGNGVQIKSNAGTLNPCWADQVNLVSRPPGTGSRNVFIDFAVTCQGEEGYITPNEPVELARITFKANAAGSFALISDPSKAIVTDRATGADILKTMDQKTITVTADTQKPTVAIIEGLAEGVSTASADVTFKVQGTEVPERPADVVKPANYIEYHYKWDTDTAFSAWTSNATVNKVVQHGARSLTVEARDLAGNISAPVVRKFNANLVPTISSVTPAAAVANTEITISGFNFGATKGTVTFGTVAAPATSITAWTNTSIKVKVPANAGSGVKVTPVGSGAPASSVAAFTLQSKLDLVFAAPQGVPGAGEDRKVDVTLVSGAKKIVLPNQIAKWDTTQLAYRVLTDDLGTDFAAGAWTLSVKDGNHLRKKYGAVTLAKGVANAVVKKAATDSMRAGDFNNDNKINISDFGLIIASFTKLGDPATGDKVKFDINGDGVIHIQDITLLLTNYTALEVAGDTE